MIYATSPINTINSNNTTVSLADYKQTQTAMAYIAINVYDSLAVLTGSGDNGITESGINDLKTLLENENMTDKNLYKLVSTLSNRFGMLSTDGATVNVSDFMSATKFAVAQSYTQSAGLDTLIQNGLVSVPSQYKSAVGDGNAKTLAIMSFLDNVSQETITQIASALNKANNSSKVTYEYTKPTSNKTITSLQSYSTFEYAV